MSEEYEETKELGQVACPKCKSLITIKKKVTYDREERRHKLTETLIAEKTVQETL